MHPMKKPTPITNRLEREIMKHAASFYLPLWRVIKPRMLRLERRAK